VLTSLDQPLLMLQTLCIFIKRATLMRRLTVLRLPLSLPHSFQASKAVSRCLFKNPSPQTSAPMATCLFIKYNGWACSAIYVVPESNCKVCELSETLEVYSFLMSVVGTFTIGHLFSFEIVKSINLMDTQINQNYCALVAQWHNTCLTFLRLWV